MKKIVLLLLLLLGVFLFGCEKAKIYISENNIEVELNKRISFKTKYEGIPVYYESGNPDVLEISGYKGNPLKEGYVTINMYSNDDGTLLKQYLFEVVDKTVKSITISGDSKVTAGDMIILNLNDIILNDNVIWESLDESVAIISQSNNSNAYIQGKKEGIVTIKASLASDSNVYDEFVLWVIPNETFDKTDIKFSESTEKIDISNMTKALSAIINKTKTSVIGVKSFYQYFGSTKEAYNASGIIYKRTCILENGQEVLESDIDYNTIDKFLTFKYYVVTNKHIVNNMKIVKVYDETNEYPCTIIASDKKVNISVLTFESQKYYSTAEFGDSENVDSGEFVLCIGNNLGSEYYHTSTFGVVSYNNRYLADDTDGDGVSDWDALYIQHDAATSDGSSGGALVDMNGKVIGINTLRISDVRIDNMGFAIPSNLLLELVKLLEQGIIPERPLLNVSVYEVKDILANEVLQKEYYIPENINYGIYVAEVDKGGVADKAGIKPNDIILYFNGNKMSFSYELRAVINECIIGSNEEIEIIVYRDGKEIILKVVF